MNFLVLVCRKMSSVYKKEKVLLYIEFFFLLFNPHLGCCVFIRHYIYYILYFVLHFISKLGDMASACIYFVNLTFLRFCFHSISHSTHRTFGKQQWQQLHDSLSSWKANLAAVKSSLQALSPSA